MNDTKNEIIIQCIDLIYNGEKQHYASIREKLKKLANFYKVNVSLKSPAVSQKKALNDFIENKKGYITTIPQLYNVI